MAGLAPTPLGENEGMSADMPSFPGMEQKSGRGQGRESKSPIRSATGSYQRDTPSGEGEGMADIIPKSREASESIDSAAT